MTVRTDMSSHVGVRAMGIRDRPISPGSPWQNGHAERLIGTVTARVSGSRDDHRCRAFATCPRPVCHLLQRGRTHLALRKDAPLGRTVQPCGEIVAIPVSVRIASSSICGYDFRKGQVERMRRIGVLVRHAEGDPAMQSWLAAFRQGARGEAWMVGEPQCPHRLSLPPRRGSAGARERVVRLQPQRIA